MTTTHTKEHTEKNVSKKADLLLETINLRDYFAAKAMPVAMTQHSGHYPIHALEQDSFLAWVAQRSYKMADAIMEARSK